MKKTLSTSASISGAALALLVGSMGFAPAHADSLEAPAPGSTGGSTGSTGSTGNGSTGAGNHGAAGDPGWIDVNVGGCEPGMTSTAGRVYQKPSAQRIFNDDYVRPATFSGNPQLAQKNRTTLTPVPGQPTTFDLKVTTKSGQKVNAPDATYVAQVGDGVCGQETYVKVSHGRFTVPARLGMLKYQQQLMIQVFGPSADQDVHNGKGYYYGVNSAGKLVKKQQDGPALQVAGLIQPSGTYVVPGTSSNNPGRNANTGLPVINQGATGFPLRSVGNTSLKAGAPVSVSYTEGTSVSSATIKNIGHIEKTKSGYRVAGPAIGELPSGRYSFHVTDTAGKDQVVHLFVADNSADGTNGLAKYFYQSPGASSLSPYGGYVDDDGHQPLGDPVQG